MKIIGYDFDGVFINIEDEKAALFGEILQKRWRGDPHAAADAWLLNLGTPRKHKFDLMYRGRFEAEMPLEAYLAVEEEFSLLLVKDYYPRATLIPETAQAAQDLNKEFDLSFVSSGVPHEELEHLMTALGLDRHFDRILGMNDAFESKVDHFNLITEATAPTQGIFIGDGLEDMRVARQFGFFAIALPTNHPPTRLREAGADVVCELPDLQQVIRRRIALLQT
jgi:phosphoglycolate phosphatase-like HAD superfamily hydrolase